MEREHYPDFWTEKWKRGDLLAHAGQTDDEICVHKYRIQTLNVKSRGPTLNLSG